MSENNLSPNLPPDVCVHTRVRGKSIEILQLMKKNGALMFWEIRDSFGISKDLTKVYLRNLRNYGLVEKTKQGWYLTGKGKQFLERYERVVKLGNKIGDNLSSNLSPNLSHQNNNLSPNLSPYNNNNNTEENNNINNIGNSFLYAEISGSLNNKVAPSFLGFNSNAQKVTHTYIPTVKSVAELQAIKSVFVSKFGSGATIGRKVVYQVLSTTLPYVDKRSIKSRIEKLVSIGFLQEVGEGLYKINGGQNETV